MIQTTGKASPQSQPTNISTIPMDLTSPRLFQPQSLYHGELQNASLYGKSKGNPFADDASSADPDPLCKLNLKETSEFVKSLPMANGAAESRGFLEFPVLRRRDWVNSATNRKLEAPPTPGRPIFSFGAAAGTLPRKSFSSKWDDAEKWLISSNSFQDSPACHSITRKPISESSKKTQKPGESFIKQHSAEVSTSGKCRVTEEKNSSKVVPLSPGSASNGVLSSALEDVLLKDKLTNDEESFLPNLRYTMEPTKEGFVFRSSASESMKDAATEMVASSHEVQHRDIGTEMTPLGSSTTSTCHTPFKSCSPVRHNTPASRSGPLALDSSIDISQLQDCHLAKLHLGGTQFDSVTSNWSSREEEEEDVSKSLRHFETGNEYRRSSSISESRVSSWEDEEKTKCCFRYQSEEAKIQAWVNLQSAKAEAQSKKLEVKIQKMRSNLEEKLMKRMAVVQRKAEEWRATAQLKHSEQILKVGGQAQRMMKQRNSHSLGHSCCGCIPCTNHYF